MLRAVPFLLLMVLQDVTSMESISELMKKHPTWSVSRTILNLVVRMYFYYFAGNKGTRGWGEMER